VRDPPASPPRRDHQDDIQTRIEWGIE